MENEIEIFEGDVFSKNTRNKNHFYYSNRRVVCIINDYVAYSNGLRCRGCKMDTFKRFIDCESVSLTYRKKENLK